MGDGRVIGAENASLGASAGGERGGDAAEFGDQGIGMEGGVGGDRPEDLDQDGSLPFRRIRL